MSRDFEAIMRGTISNETDITKNEVISLPPGYLVGFDVRLRPDYTVVVSAGAANVGGSLVKKSDDHQLAEADWVLERYNADRHFYIYLTKDGSFKVDIIAPVWNDSLLYYEHPDLQWRAIGKMFVAGGNIVFGIKEVEKTEQTVTVAPHGFTGEADYYCNRDSPYGNNDQILINAAIQYMSESYGGGTVRILPGDFYCAGVTQPSWTVASVGVAILLFDYDNIVLSGSGKSSVIHLDSTNKTVPMLISKSNANTVLTSNSVVENLYLYNDSSAGTASAVASYYSDNMIVRGLTIYNFTTGIAGVNALNILIENNYIDSNNHSSSATGIYVDGQTRTGSDAKILNNVVKNQYYLSNGPVRGIGVQYFTDVLISGNTISHIVCDYDYDDLFGAAGIYLASCDRAQVVSNDIRDITNGSNTTYATGIVINSICNDDIISGNSISSCSKGVYLVGNNCTISNNDIYSFSSTGNVYGVYIGASAVNNIISGNNINTLDTSNGSAYAVYLTTCYGCEVSGNRISAINSNRSCYGIYVGGVPSAGLTGTVITSNIISDIESDDSGVLTYGICSVDDHYANISDNTVSDIDNDYNSDCTGILASGDYIIVSHNTVTEGGNIGITIGGSYNSVVGNYCQNNGSDTGIANTNGHNFLNSGTDTQVYSNSWQQPVAGEPSIGEFHPLLTSPSASAWWTISATAIVASVTNSYLPVGANGILCFVEMVNDYLYLMTSKYSGCTCTGAFMNMTMLNNTTSRKGDRVFIPVDSSRKFYCRSWSGATAVGGAGTYVYFSPIGYYS